VGSGVGSAHADVAEFAGDSEGDVAGLGDAVVTDPVVGVGVTAAAGERLRERVVSRGRGGPVW
jgi:hypothetical protein